MDEDEYQYAVEYLGIKASDETLEDLFFQMDYNLMGKIDYEEFREIFLLTCDLRKELEDRGIDCPSFVRKKTLRSILKGVLMDEEDRERKAMAEAKRYKQWVLNCRECKKLLQKSEFRAYRELRAALDAAGHVYVIGSGAYNQFDQPVYERLETKKFKFEFFDKVVELWRDRVKPEQLVDRLRALRRAQQQEEDRDADRNLSGIGLLARNVGKSKTEIDPFIEAQHSPFTGLRVTINTASLWGRRVHQTACSENVIFALADTGEIFAWGGNSYWWHEIQPDSIYQTKWRGDTTARSQLLMGTRDKVLPPDVSLEQDLDALSPEDRKAEIIKVIAKYYNVWEPPPNPGQRMLYMEKDILPKIEYDDVKFSIILRGKLIGDMNKWQLIEEFYDDILLEKKLLGERAHKAIREIEMQIKGLKKRKKLKLADKFAARVEEMWKPLREVQAEKKANEIQKKMAEQHEKALKEAENYQEWRQRVAHKREGMEAQLTPRGNGYDIDLIGATPRGPAISTPRGYEAALQISSGAAHACLVHKTGQLYTWGVGIAGRLGLDTTEQGNPQADTSKPRLVQGLAERPVIRVSCGYSHTGAIVAGGDLYMWGSTATGKCGLGEIITNEECFCSIPTRVLVSAEDRKITKLSCGAAHSAVITEAGHLYVFGCGDGGRLGLGSLGTRYVPTLVESLMHEKIASVSCGNTTTLICTEINRQWVGNMDDKYRKFVGGKMYVSGTANVLGRQYNAFTHLRVRKLNADSNDNGQPLIQYTEYDDEMDDVCVKQVAAGYSHSAILSSDGELFCWGRNRSGCLGAPPHVRFIDHPTPVPFLYTKPKNLARNKKAYQSTTFNCREAQYGVNGRKEGNGLNRITCTQQESQPWLEVDLGEIAVIDKIVVWNRTDVPADKNLARDLYTSRLFPCWIMVGRDPFPKEANVSGLKESLRIAVARGKFTEDKRVSTWRCPASTQGRYVRVQLERYNSLSIAEIEIFGYWGYTAGVGRCSHVSVGRDVTCAVVRPSVDPRDVESMYKRAAYADALNADILRQFETYTLEYDKYGRGEVLMNDCMICRNIDPCESCVLYKTFSKEIASMPPLVGGKRQRLNAIADFLINSNKPPLPPIIVPKSVRPSKWQLRSEALFGKINIGQILWPKQKAYIKPEEAMATDPKALMKTLDYMKKVDFDPKHEPHEQVAPSPQKKGGRFESLDEMTAQGTLDTQSISPRESIGTVEAVREPHRHGFGKNQRIEVGDLLPTGHRVKEAFPKSIVEQIEGIKLMPPQPGEGSEEAGGSSSRKGKKEKKK